MNDSESFHLFDDNSIKVKNAFFTLLLIILSNTLCYSQVKEVGIPFINNYSRREYNAGTQNWSVIQDDRDIMYFANNNGILEFDGVDWRIYPVPNRSVIRSLAIDQNGRVYAGAFSEFGYLATRPNGELKYYSLSDKMDTNADEIREVWKIHVINDGIYFQTFTHLFEWYNDSIKSVLQNRDFHFSFLIDSTIYIQELGKGIFKYNRKEYSYINGSNVLNNSKIWTVFTYNNSILFGTGSEGFFEYNRRKGIFTRWNSPLNDFFIENQIYSGTKINDEYYAVGTILKGLVIFNSRGELVQYINNEHGLQNNTVLSLYEDKSQNLWLGLDNGISYIKNNSPITALIPLKGIGSGYVSLLYEDFLYLGTNQGLFYSKWSDILNGKYNLTLVDNTQGQVWSLYQKGNELLCGHHDGTFIIKNNTSTKISDIDGGWKFTEIPGKPDVLIQGNYTGLSLFRKEKESDGSIKWKFDNPVKGFNESCRFIEITEQNSLWVSHGYEGVYNLFLNEALDSVLHVDFYNSDNGFPTDINITVHKFDNRIVFSCDSGFYKFNPKDEYFVPDKKLNSLFGNFKIESIIKEDENKYWYFQNQELGLVIKKIDGNYFNQKIHYSELKGNFIYTYENLLPVDQNNIILGTIDGFLHFDPYFNKETEDQIKLLIRNIESNNDTVLYGGSPGKNKNAGDSIKLSLLYMHNNLHFAYAVVDYENENIYYQYILENFDKDWSEWSKHTYKEYTNIPEGKYYFKVRAKDDYDQLSESAIVEINILPPWYRSLVAYSIYFSILALFIFLIIRHFVKRFEKEKLLLKEKQKKELAEREKKHQETTLIAGQEIFKLKNEKLLMENEKKEIELENRTKELASVVMQISSKNEVLNSLRNKLQRVSHKMLHEESREKVKGLIRTIEKDIQNRDDWSKFELHFDQVHENFLKNLKFKYPELTPNDLRLCAYLRMNLSTKEIAPLLNISVRGVEIARYRLRKKLSLDHHANLTDFLLNF